MGMLCFFLAIFSGVVFSSQDAVPQSELRVTARPGDNITIYCDCKYSVRVHVVWYRKCSHENQPPLILRTGRSEFDAEVMSNFYHFHLVKNHSSYNLLITNITTSDEGLYYCGTEEVKVEDNNRVSLNYVYTYSTVKTRIIFNSNEPHDNQNSSNCGLCWTLLYTLCPVIAGLSSLFSSLLSHKPCHKGGKDAYADEKTDPKSQMQVIQDEDIWVASQDFHQALQRRGWSSDLTFCTYSPITISQTGMTERINMKMS